jgi:hypothetical protein
MLDVQLDVAKAIRGSDPARVVFFTTRAGFGPGVTVADFSAWENLGNVAFDIHDYFGARWGDGLGGEVEQDDDYQEVIQLLYNHILADEGVPPYGGTAQVQAEFMAQAEEHLDEFGIPLLIGEAGDYVTDPGAAAFFATMTGAANYLGVSWLVSAFAGDLGRPGSPKHLPPGLESRPPEPRSGWACEGGRRSCWRWAWWWPPRSWSAPPLAREPERSTSRPSPGGTRPSAPRTRRSRTWRR